ncbi:MAG: hypothetical protein U0269_27880 [Polyangiales bacterium]
MTESNAPDADLEALGVALRPFAAPPAAEDTAAFNELFARIRSVCAARVESEDAMELLLGAYAKHPELLDGGAITAEFLQTAERCLRTGVASDTAHIQLGFYCYELRDFEKSLSHWESARTEVFSAYWAGIVLEYRVACLARLGQMSRSLPALTALAARYATDRNDMAVPIGLDRAIMTTPGALRATTPHQLALLKSIGEPEHFRWSCEGTLSDILARHGLPIGATRVGRSSAGEIALHTPLNPGELDQRRVVLSQWVSAQSEIRPLFSVLCECDLAAAITLALALIESLDERVGHDDTVARALASVRRLCAGESLTESELREDLDSVSALPEKRRAGFEWSGAEFRRAEAVRDLLAACLSTDDCDRSAQLVLDAVSSALQAASSVGVKHFDDGDHLSVLLPSLLHAVEHLSPARSA